MEKQIAVMTEEQELFVEIGKKLKDSEQSQMFGKPFFKMKWYLN